MKGFGLSNQISLQQQFHLLLLLSEAVTHTLFSWSKFSWKCLTSVMNQFLPVDPQSLFIIQLHYHYNVANYRLLKDVVTSCDVPPVSVPQCNYEGTRKLHGQEFQRAFPGCMLELCLYPPGSAWQRANKYTSTVLISFLKFLCFHVYIFLLLLVCCFTDHMHHPCNSYWLHCRENHMVPILAKYCFNLEHFWKWEMGEGQMWNPNGILKNLNKLYCWQLGRSKIAKEKAAVRRSEISE